MHYVYFQVQKKFFLQPPTKRYKKKFKFTIIIYYFMITHYLPYNQQFLIPLYS